MLTFASGPTNSMRGAAFLSGVQDAIVIDIGGTTSDVGVLNGGFPRQASARVKVRVYIHLLFFELKVNIGPREQEAKQQNGLLKPSLNRTSQLLFGNKVFTILCCLQFGV